MLGCGGSGSGKTEAHSFSRSSAAGGGGGMGVVWGGGGGGYRFGGACARHDPHFPNFHRHLHGAGRGLPRPAPYSVQASSEWNPRSCSDSADTSLILYNAVCMAFARPPPMSGGADSVCRAAPPISPSSFRIRPPPRRRRVAGSLGNSAGADLIRPWPSRSKLGVLVMQLAVSVSNHDYMLASGAQTRGAAPAATGS